MSQAFSNHGRKFNKPTSGVFLLTPMSPTNPLHIYEVRPRKDKRGVNLISDALPFGRLGPKTGGKNLLHKISPGEKLEAP